MTEIPSDFKFESIGPVSYESDEESFVVLGKSLGNDIDDVHNVIDDQNSDNEKKLENAKKIIEEELKRFGSSEVKTGDEFLWSKPSLTEMQSILQSFQQSFHENVIQTNSVDKTNNHMTEVEGAFKGLSVSQNSVDPKMFTNSEISDSAMLLQKLGNEPGLKGGENGAIPKKQNNLKHVSNEKKEHLKSMSLEDLQKMIVEIVEENTQLRKTLDQNNIKMSEQCSRVDEWQNEVKKVHDAHKEKILEAKAHIDKLIIEKNEAKNEAIALQDELNVTRTKLAEIQIVQTEMQQSRSTAHSTIKYLEEEIQRLQSIINDLQQKESNDDRIYVLETQLELYKKDFEEERRIKEIIREEKEKMSEDIQNLQRRNQQLQERIETICDKDFLMYEARRHIPRSSGNNASEAILQCPKCNSAFGDMSALENHCHHCIT